MRARWKRHLSLALSLLMVISLLPVSALATEGESGSGATEQETAYIAQIGEQGYETLAAAISAAESGATVKLLKDVELTDAQTISKNIMLDLNGHTLKTADVTGDASNKYPCSKNVLSISKAEVTIKDSSEAKTGVVISGTVTNSYNNSGPNTITCTGIGSLTLDGATVKGAKAVNSRNAGNAITLPDNAGFTLNVINDAKVYGGENNKHDVTSETYSSLNCQYSGDAGIAINAQGATVKITDSTVVGGEGTRSGTTQTDYISGGPNFATGAYAITGTVAYGVWGTVNITNSTVTGGGSDLYNAEDAIYVRAYNGKIGQVIIENSTVTGGSARTSYPGNNGIGGAALCVYGGVVTMTDSTITGGDGGQSWTGSGIELYTNTVGYYDQSLKQMVYPTNYPSVTATNSTISGGEGGRASGNNGAAVWVSNDTGSQALKLSDATLICQNDSVYGVICGNSKSAVEIKMNGAVKVNYCGEDTTIDKAFNSSSATVTYDIAEAKENLYVYDESEDHYILNTGFAAKIDDRIYSSVEAALAAAKDGEAITLLDNGEGTDIKAAVGIVAGETEKDVSLTVNAGAGTVTFDSAAVKTIKEKADADAETVMVSIIKNTEKSTEETTVYEITLAGADVSKTGGGFGDGGTAAVTVPAPEDTTAVAVYYVDGEDKTLVGTYPVVDGCVTFTVEHFSTYSVENTGLSEDDVAYIQRGNTYTGYTTLADALAAAQGGDAITLLKDVALTESIAYNKEGDITIDGKGYKLAPAATNTIGYHVMELGNDAGNAVSGTYTLKDIEFNGFNLKGGVVLRLSGPQKVVLKDVTFTNCDMVSTLGNETKGKSDYSVIRVYNTSFEADNLTMKNCKGGVLIDFGAASGAYAGTTVIKNSMFQSNTVYGTAVIMENQNVDDSTFTLTDTTFNQNTVGVMKTNSGRAVVYTKAAENTVSGCTFYYNKVYGAYKDVVSGILAKERDQGSKTTTIAISDSSFKTGYVYNAYDPLADNVAGAAIAVEGNATLSGDMEVKNNRYYYVPDSGNNQEQAKRALGSFAGSMTISAGTYDGEIVTMGTTEVAVSGGAYSTDVNEYCVEGYKATAEGDTWIVELDMDAFAAKIEETDTYCITLEAAINAAQNGETVKLLKDATGNVTVPADKTITLDLNGKTLTNNVPQKCTIDNYGTLTITGNGTVDTTPNKTAALMNRPGGTVVVKGGTYTRSAEIPYFDGGANNNSYYTVVNAGTMTIDNGVVTCAGNQTSLLWNSGAMTINDGQFTNSANVVKCEAGTLDINGGTFTMDNRANKWWGGNILIQVTTGNGVSSENRPVANITGGTFQALGSAKSSNPTYVNTSVRQGFTASNYGTINVSGTTVLTVDDGRVLRANANGTINVSGGNFAGSNIDFTVDKFSAASTGTLSLTGGTYSVEPDSSYVADGYVVYHVGEVYNVALPNHTHTGNPCSICGYRHTVSGGGGGGAVSTDDDPCKDFTDIEREAWYHEAIDYAITNGLMNGYGNGKFAPNANLSRAMLCQIFYNKEGRPAVTAENPFTDVPAGQWYTDAVVWAYENKIVDGYGNGKFGPDDDITREQLAAIIWRYDGKKASTASLDAFSDADKINNYAVDALKWAYENKVVSGKGNGILDPLGKATRAEVAQMLMNYLSK